MVTAEALWKQFLQETQMEDCAYEAWSFGVNPDELARLVAAGQKTGTSSAYALYELSDETLPQVNDYSVILDAHDEAVCVIKNIRVETLPFRDVTQEHARKEGEGDLSLAYWKRVHEAYFRQCFREAGLTFTEDALVVYEEFAVVYRAENAVS